MKRIFNLFWAVLLTTTTLAQSPESSERLFFMQNKAEWVEVADFTAGVTNDSIRGIIYDSKKYQRVDLNASTFNAQSLMIRADGTDMSALINRRLQNTAVKEIVIGQLNGGEISISDDIDLKGKTLRFTGFAKLKRLSGNPVIKNGIIIAPAHSQIVDTLIGFSNIKTGDGKFFPTWVGAKADGVSNDVRFWQTAANIAADNRLQFTIPKGMHYIKGDFYFKTNGSLVSLTGAKINIAGGTQFYFKSKCDSVLVKDNDIEVISRGTVKDIFRLGSDTGISVNLSIINNKIQAHRRGGSVIAIRNVDNVTINNNFIDSSYNKGIEVKYASDVYIYNNNVTNSGRSGICASSHIRRIYVRYNYGRGSAQCLDLTDGVFDIYGPDVEDAFFENNYAETGYDAYLGKKNHILYRFQGFRRLKFKNNIGVATSPYLLYAVRFSNRDNYYSEDIDAAGNKIYIKGNYSSIINTQGIKDLTFKDYEVVIDSTTATPSSPVLFRFSKEPGLIDTLSHVNISGGVIDANNKSLTIIYNTTPVGDIDFSGTSIVGLKSSLIEPTITNEIRSFRWIGGNLKSSKTSSSAAIYVNNRIRSFRLIDINAEKGNDSLWALENGYNGEATIMKNIINGKRTKETRESQ